MTVRHPTSWRLVRPTNLSAGAYGDVAYLTDQPTTSICSTTSAANGTQTITCDGPVHALRPGGVLITFTGEFLVPRAPTTHNRVLDGHPATAQAVLPESANCVTGATEAIRMTVFLALPTEGAGQTVVMSACYAGPNSTATKQNIDALIDSVAFT